MLTWKFSSISVTFTFSVNEQLASSFTLASCWFHQPDLPPVSPLCTNPCPCYSALEWCFSLIFAPCFSYPGPLSFRRYEGGGANAAVLGFTLRRWKITTFQHINCDCLFASFELMCFYTFRSRLIRCVFFCCVLCLRPVEGCGYAGVSLRIFEEITKLFKSVVWKWSAIDKIIFQRILWKLDKASNLTRKNKMLKYTIQQHSCSVERNKM